MSTRKLCPIVSSIIFVACAAGACIGNTDEPELSSSEHALTPTAWISEEDGTSITGGVHCPAGEVAVGYECDGSFCDNIRLLCDTFPGTLGAQSAWSVWFEAGTASARCAGLDEWITGIQCRGDWCDDIRFRCRRATAGVRSLERQNPPLGPTCITPPAISEETGPLNLEDTGRFLIGMSCSGTHCDNVGATACTPQARCKASLSCGFSAAASCQCDNACVSFGDCCSNKAAECP